MIKRIIIFAMLLTCIAQKAMQLSELHIIKEIKTEENVHDIKQFSNYLVIRTYCAPDVTVGEIKRSDKAAGRTILFDMQNLTKIAEVTTRDALLSPIAMSIPNNITLKDIKIEVIDVKEPLITFYIPDKKVYTYNYIDKEFKACTEYSFKKQRQKELDLTINGKEIQTITLQKKEYEGGIKTDRVNKNMYIQHKKTSPKKMKILKPKMNKIYVGDAHILIYSYSFSQGGFLKIIEPELDIYDINTGTAVASTKQFEQYIPCLQKGQDATFLNKVVFGKNDAFVLLVFWDRLFLYDLRRLEPLAQYALKEKELETLDISIIISNNQNTIIVSIGNTIYFLENPLTKKFDDLFPERTKYVLDTKCPRAQGEKEKIVIQVNGNKIPVDRSLLLLG